MVLGEVKPELHQSMVEVGTKVCHTPAEVKAELVRLREAGDGPRRQERPAHRRRRHAPVLLLDDQEITPLERYIGVREDLQDLAQQLLIFGTHVHIGIEDREFLIDCDERVALLAAARPRAVDQLAVLDGPAAPGSSRTAASCSGTSRAPGMPPHARHRGTSSRRWSTALVNTNCIPNGSKIWWDVRPQLELSHARVPHLRRLHAGGRGGVHRRHLPGDHREAVEAAARQHDVPRSIRRRADRGEQVARGALRPRRQADRLRAGTRSCPRGT